MTNPQFFTTPQGRKIAYHKTEGALPGVMFLGGFKSDMTGAKAMALEAFCKARGQQFIRFDYSGHGESSGEFKDGTIGQWKEDALAVLDKLSNGPQILVGSSMGGWIMLLVALAQPKQVAGLVGIAAAPDFTEHLLWDSFTPEQQEEVRKNGFIDVPNCYDDEPYPITLELIAESGNHLVLDGPIDIHCPVHLIHGMEDKDVPWAFSVTLNEKIVGKDVRTMLVDHGDHRMSSEKHLKIITNALEKMLVKLEQTEEERKTVAVR